MLFDNKEPLFVNKDLLFLSAWCNRLHQALNRFYDVGVHPISKLCIFATQTKNQKRMRKIYTTLLLFVASLTISAQDSNAGWPTGIRMQIPNGRI